MTITSDDSEAEGRSDAASLMDGVLGDFASLSEALAATDGHPGLTPTQATLIERIAGFVGSAESLASDVRGDLPQFERHTPSELERAESSASDLSDAAEQFASDLDDDHPDLAEKARAAAGVFADLAYHLADHAELEEA